MLDLQYLRGVVVVRLRALSRHTMDSCLLDRLGAALTYIGSDRSIVLTGIGDVFAPDIAADSDLVKAKVLSRVHEVRRAIAAHPHPVAAAINGDAIGAGWALAEAADVRIMSGGVIAPEHGVRYGVTAAWAAGLVEHTTAPANLLDHALTLADRLRPRAAAG
ncbi:MULTISPECIES: enoyl-CoA hydratase-related protein [Amycolatopsis]|uniref:Enoyl-CoA hydratase/isomerase family protein n=1 Tax=Amycolatopsis bullii TaxID=941987 RepID=A0ABQ3JY17_9PSEU|nr:enoyl-CoA hydratase-related protein [Amycolatopsis bullii]GHF93940.1 hypothetical protein GCM10017567_05470 [Amycolatopsis bullii]